MEVALITAGLVVSSLWSLICRIRHMAPGTTRPAVVTQHAALALALFASLLLPPAWSKLALATGVLLFLLLGSRRWRDAAPVGTEKPCAHAEPMQVEPRHWDRVVGGREP